MEQNFEVSPRSQININFHILNLYILSIISIYVEKISNIGDCGITCDFGDEVNKNTNKEVIKLLILFKSQ